MFDYSLLEKYTKVTHKARVFDLTGDDVEDFEELMTAACNNSGIKILLRKDYFSERTGVLLVHVEWVKYSKENASPFYTHFQKKLVINPSAI